MKMNIKMLWDYLKTVTEVVRQGITLNRNTKDVLENAIDWDSEILEEIETIKKVQKKSGKGK